MFLLCSDPSDALRLHEAAKKLHKAMWQQDLGSRLQDVDNLKYLPATEVEGLRLQELGCDAKVILVRREYLITMNTFEGRQNNSGGMVITGHPGIGMILLLNVLLMYS